MFSGANFTVEFFNTELNVFGLTLGALKLLLNRIGSWLNWATSKALKLSHFFQSFIDCV